MYFVNGYGITLIPVLIVDTAEHTGAEKGKECTTLLKTSRNLVYQIAGRARKSLSGREDQQMR